MLEIYTILRNESPEILSFGYWVNVGLDTSFGQFIEVYEDIRYFTTLDNFEVVKIYKEELIIFKFFVNFCSEDCTVDNSIGISTNGKNFINIETLDMCLTFNLNLILDAHSTIFIVVPDEYDCFIAILDQPNEFIGFLDLPVNEIVGFVEFL